MNGASVTSSFLQNPHPGNWGIIWVSTDYFHFMRICTFPNIVNCMWVLIYSRSALLRFLTLFFMLIFMLSISHIKTLVWKAEKPRFSPLKVFKALLNQQKQMDLEYFNCRAMLKIFDLPMTFLCTICKLFYAIKTLFSYAKRQKRR